MQKVRLFGDFLLRTIFNPVTVISGLSLWVHNNAMTKIRAEIGIPYGFSDEQIKNLSHLPKETQELGLMMNKPWWYAMNDYNMQILILIVALILSFYQLLSNSIGLWGYSFASIKDAANRHNSSYIFYVVSVIFFLTGVITLFIANSFAGINVLSLYLPSGKITGENRLPPWGVVTIARGICIIYIGYLTFYFTHYFPDLIEQLKSTKKR